MTCCPGTSARSHRIKIPLHYSLLTFRRFTLDHGQLRDPFVRPSGLLAPVFSASASAAHALAGSKTENVRLHNSSTSHSLSLAPLQTVSGMNTVSRYIFLTVLILLGFHFILSLTHQGYGRATSLRTIFSTVQKPNTTIPEIYYIPKENCQVNTRPSFYDDKRANATIVMLARNSDLDFAVRSIRELEDRFNRKYQYPYTFLNEEEFSEEFKT
jgi:hypothetical protein